ncbi:LysM peptidoglycan-binding domain-containing protein [Agathobaculum desmolans]|uniref:LysM peptidoglycan-binding domain-containing protein n=1 Tax=Agathobaculum desmolans TaxID=39484 RepID=UPI00248F1E0A|nr:LysM peptidoglycan-binding domain-containing protein [Agathobaculum desmolans]
MYQFYMDDMLLPVTPGAMTLKVANQNKTVTLINEGEINILKLPGLSKISFNALLPNKEYPFAQYESGFQNAHYYMDKLELLKTKCLPFQFQVIRTDDRGEMLMDSLDMQVSLEEYELEENAEEYEFDVMAKIELKQYKTYGTKTIEFKKTETTTEATVTEKRDTSTAPKTTGGYTVVSGDNLWDIARVKLGDGSRMDEIYELNKDTIEAAVKKYGRSSSSNGWWIYPGTVLQLPS